MFDFNNDVIFRRAFSFQELKDYESPRWKRFKRDNSHVLKPRQTAKGIKTMLDFYDCLGVSFEEYASQTGYRLGVQQIRMNPKTNEELRELLYSKYKPDNYAQCAIAGDWVNFSPKDDASLPPNVIEIDKDMGENPVAISKEELENNLRERKVYYGF